MTGLATIHGRIAEIQGRFAAMVPAVPQARSGDASPAAPPVGQPDFRAAFQSALAATGGAPPGPQFRPWSPSTAGATAGLTSSPSWPGSSAQPWGVTGDDVVAAARKYLGVPYLWGGTDPAQGLDCSGLVERTYADLGVDLPRVSRDQARAGTAVPSLAQARPGDLVAFNDPVDHIGIYLGNGQMIVAPSSGDVVKVQDVYETPTAIRRVLPDGPGQPVPATGGLPAPVWAGGVLPAGTPYADLFVSAGRQHGVDPALLAAVAKAESAFNPRAVSHAGAQGLMQLMPGTAKELGVADPFDPAQAVDGAARLLAQHLGTFGSVDLALAAYNAGPAAVRRYGGIPPYAETQAYVRKITNTLAAP